MNFERSYLLYLAGCGARKQPAQAPAQEIDWDKLVEEAKRLKIESFAGYALKLSDCTRCPDELRHKVIKSLMEQGMKYHFGWHRLAEIQEKLKLEGISTAVMKGYALSTAYAVPELRIGADVDLFVQLKDEKRALRWFRDQGFSILERRKRDNHHSTLYKTEFGIIELHVALHSKSSAIYAHSFHADNCVWLPSEPFVPIKKYDSCIYALSYHEHVLFLCSHLLRHLVQSELVHARLLLDLSAFIKTYANKIDMDRLWHCLDEINCGKLICAVLRAGELYFGYTYDFPLPDCVSDEEVHRLVDEFCEDKVLELEERIRMRNQYAGKASKKGIEINLYRIRMLKLYASGMPRKIKKYGFCGMITMATSRIRGMSTRNLKTACLPDENTALTDFDKKAALYRDLGLM